MRVEKKPTVQLGMVKKKHRLRKQQKDANEFPDSSDEGGIEGSCCPHVSKAINLNLVKKAIKNHGITGDCMVCKGGDTGSKASVKTEVNNDETEPIEDALETTIWICLQCGNQGCDRNSKEKHALKHYETPRTGSHDLCFNLTTTLVWCYGCDDEVSVEISKKLAECTEFVRKQVGVGPSHQQGSGKKSLVHKAPEVQNEEAANNHQEPKEDKQKSDKQNKSKTGAGQATQNLLGLPKVRGLSNLGNTCFFNAVMQNLSQTPILVTVLNERVQKGTSIQLLGRQLSVTDGTDSEDSAHNSSEEEKEPKVELNPLHITLGDGGSLTSSLLSFMKDMHNTTAKGPVVTPSSLFGQVCKKAPRFKGFQQQDSHELLRCLLDSMKAEEVKRSQAGILNAFSLPANINNRQVDDDTKLKVKCYGVQVKHTFVDSIFGGMFISTVQCEECQMPSQILEPFLDVSLPVTEEKTVRPGNFGRKKDQRGSNDTDELSKPTNAMDELAASSKPSKHMAKKERKKSKKEAKKKKKKPFPSTQEASESKDGNEKDANADEGSGSSDDEVEADSKQMNGDCPAEMVKGGKLEDAPVFDEGENGDQVYTEKSGESQIIGLSLKELDEKDNNRDMDTDSNKAMGSNSDVDLSNSDADVEDNIDASRSSPVDQTLHNATRNENAMDYGSHGSNLNSVCKYHEGTVPTTTLCDSKNCDNSNENGEINNIANSMCNGNIHSNGIDTADDNSTISKIVQTEEKEVQENTSSAFKQLNDVSQGIKSMSIMDRNDDDEIAYIDENKKSSFLFKMESVDNIHKLVNNYCNNSTSTLNSKNNSNGYYANNSNGNSRPNTPQSPKLSRSSSLKNSATATAAAATIGSQLINRFNQNIVEARREAMRSLSGHRYQPDSKECSIQSCLNQFTAAELLTGNNKFGCDYCTRKKKTSVDKDGKKEKVYTNASKQLLIFNPPAVLTLHMKRFQQVGFSLRKVNRHVDFPLVLDLAPYCSTLSQGIKPGQTKVLYSLYGIVEHSGRLTGGHYTAYVKVRPNSTHNITAFLHHQSMQALKLDKVLVDNFESVMTEGGSEGGAVGGQQQQDFGEGVGEGVVPPAGKWYYISDSRVSETTESNVLRCQAYLLFYERIY